MAFDHHIDDLAAACRQADEHTAAALELAAEILAPEPDPAAVLAPRELPPVIGADLVDAACHGQPSVRSRRAPAHRRHRKKVAKILAAREYQRRRSGQPTGDVASGATS